MMWMDNATKYERDKISDRMEGILTIINSIKKHMVDKDMNAFSLRINKTLNELEVIGNDLEKDAYERATKFIRAHSQLMATF